VNDSGPLPAFAHDEERWPVDPSCGDAAAASVSDTEAAERWRGNLLASDPAAPKQDFTGDESGAGSQDFLRLCPDEETEADRTGGASRWSWLFSGRALQGAVIANGGGLIALALLMAAPDIGSKTGLMASATVLGLGLMFAAIAAVVSLDFRGAQMRLQRSAARLAAIFGAVSYGALALAALPFI
jgi:hypothetical protein